MPKQALCCLHSHHTHSMTFSLAASKQIVHVSVGELSSDDLYLVFLVGGVNPLGLSGCVAMFSLSCKAMVQQRLRLKGWWWRVD